MKENKHKKKVILRMASTPLVHFYTYSLARKRSLKMIIIKRKRLIRQERNKGD
jgi:hypothetical protein